MRMLGFTAAFLALALVSCVSPEEVRREDEATCTGFGFHLWTPPFRQGKTLGSLLRVVGCCHLSGL